MLNLISYLPTKVYIDLMVLDQMVYVNGEKFLSLLNMKKLCESVVNTEGLVLFKYESDNVCITLSDTIKFKQTFFKKKKTLLLTKLGFSRLLDEIYSYYTIREFIVGPVKKDPYSVFRVTGPSTYINQDNYYIEYIDPDKYQFVYKNPRFVCRGLTGNTLVQIVEIIKWDT